MKYKYIIATSEKQCSVLCFSDAVQTQASPMAATDAVCVNQCLTLRENDSVTATPCV